MTHHDISGALQALSKSEVDELNNIGVVEVVDHSEVDDYSVREQIDGSNAYHEHHWAVHMMKAPQRLLIDMDLEFPGLALSKAKRNLGLIVGRSDSELKALRVVDREVARPMWLYDDMTAGFNPLLRWETLDHNDRTEYMCRSRVWFLELVTIDRDSVVEDEPYITRADEDIRVWLTTPDMDAATLSSSWSEPQRAVDGKGWWHPAHRVTSICTLPTSAFPDALDKQIMQINRYNRQFITREMRREAEMRDLLMPTRPVSDEEF